MPSEVSTRPMGRRQLHISKVGSAWDTQTPHAMRMAIQYSAVGRHPNLSRYTSHKSHSCSLDHEAYIYRVGNGFAISVKGQVFGAVNDLILLIFTFIHTDLLGPLYFSLSHYSLILAPLFCTFLWGR